MPFEDDHRALQLLEKALQLLGLKWCREPGESLEEFLENFLGFTFDESLRINPRLFYARLCKSKVGEILP